METLEIIDKWNDWFAAVNDEESTKGWNATKSVHFEHALAGNNLAMLMLDRWATIIELNRLNRLEKAHANIKQDN